MEAHKNILKNIFGIKDKEKLTKVVLIMGALGMMLIFASEFVSFQPENNDKSDSDVAKISYEREKQIEKRLASIIEKIDGAGKTSVMVTLDSSNEYIYAFDSKKTVTESNDENQNSSEEKPMLIDGKNGEEAILTKVKESGIRGVAVVCEGGDKPQVAEQIISAVCAVLGIGSSKVSIAKMA